MTCHERNVAGNVHSGIASGGLVLAGHIFTIAVPGRLGREQQLVGGGSVRAQVKCALIIRGNVKTVWAGDRRNYESGEARTVGLSRVTGGFKLPDFFREVRLTRKVSMIGQVGNS